MGRVLVVVLLCFTVSYGSAQINPLQQRGGITSDFQNIRENDSTTVNDEDLPPTSQYKIITHYNDTLHFDTTQTIAKDRKFNYLRRDNFGLLRFNNIGQTYNTLAYSFGNVEQFPEMGMRSKHFNYMEVEDILYYRVPTPTTELVYKTAFEQGQMLDAMITVNTSPRLNLSIAYKGLRSLGKYQNILASTGNFRTSATYRTKDNRYHLRAHIAAQDLLNNENGGLDSLGIANFESGVAEFLDRSTFDPRFQDASNFLVGKRYYWDHNYTLARKRDSLNNASLKLDHTFNYETKFYEFEQTAANGYFGESFISSNLKDRAQLRAMYNEVGVTFQNEILGKIRGFANSYNYNYFFNSVLFREDGTLIPNNIEGNDIGVGGSWEHTIAGLDLSAKLAATITGDQGGNYFEAQAGYTLSEDARVEAKLSSSTTAPNFNMQLYQSNYQAYNWFNPGLKKQKTQHLGVHLKSDKWLNASVEYSILDDHIYFAEQAGTNADTIVVAPDQFGSSINHLSVKLQKEFTYGRFGLDNTVQFQNVSQSEDILNVPSLIARNTLYYTNRLFKKALFVQTGVTFNYFSEYNANAYNPLIGEFYTQNTTAIGNFPRLDFFVNMKVRNTRIFFKWEHINSTFTGYNFFSAPGYPYRDRIIRFGLVWNFFR